MIGRWIVFLVYVPHQVVYRRWGWTGILIGWTALVGFGALSQYVEKRQTSNGEIQMMVGSAVVIAVLLMRLNSRSAPVHAGSSGSGSSLGAPERARVAPVSLGKKTDESGGQGVAAMDRSFLRVLGDVLRTSGRSEFKINRALAAHRRLLTHPDPNRAWNYRTAMNEKAAREWPRAASQEFVEELERPWAATAEDRELWASLPSAEQVSYVKQAQLMHGAAMQGLARN